MAGTMKRTTVGVAALLAAAAALAVGAAGHSSLTEPRPLSGDIFCKRDSEQNWYVSARPMPRGWKGEWWTGWGER